MTSDEQRLQEKKAKAFQSLNEFKGWYMENFNAGNQLLFLALSRDIMNGTEQEIDKIQEGFDRQNMRAFQKKMSS